MLYVQLDVMDTNIIYITCIAAVLLLHLLLLLLLTFFAQLAYFSGDHSFRRGALKASQSKASRDCWYGIFCRGEMPFLSPNQQHQSTEAIIMSNTCKQVNVH